MKNVLIITLCMWCVSFSSHAQIMFGNTPPLHVDGKYLKDCNGNTVVLHGVMDTPSAWFNGGRWGWSYDNTGMANCIKYFDKLYTAITDTANGAYCNVFRLHLDPAWTNDNSYNYCEETGKDEANIQHFNPGRLRGYMSQLYWKLIENAIKHGLYVVVRPPGVCPGSIKVGDVYNKYLIQVWDIVTQNDSIKKYAGQVSIELANEPVNLYDADGKSSVSAKHDFFQPVVDKIRANGFTGIIWVPGTGYQSSYEDYVTNPITGYNIGYAVHVYPGWYGQNDENANKSTFITNFGKQVPVVKTNPIMVTEIDWSPEQPGVTKKNEFGDLVPANYGTWATASTSKWGNAWKGVMNYYGNIGMTLTGTGDFIDIDKSIATTPAKPVVAFDGNPECCAQACFDWYKDYAKVNYPHADYKRRWSADLGNGKFLNPIINADFPDPDVIRVGDTFYMVSTTMFHFPGATILKSKDLVNWEYCANPLQQIADNDAYNLKNGVNHYSQGQWAASLNYSKGKFYLYFICYGRDKVDETKNILLTTSDPEGKWEMKYMDQHYYDSGWLFDEGEGGDGYVYVACGINDIYVAQLRRSDLKEIKISKVISVPNSGLEGSHMYHIGDYYYIYATYGGTEGSQTIFRSNDPMGPYEEHEGRIFANQHIHQGALVDTPTGEWWTILFKDAGSIGRVPYLEPVKWTNGWPTLGTGGKDVSRNTTAYAKPKVVADGDNRWTNEYLGKKYLPTNDTFTDAALGLQWGWNHNPDNSAWSLFEKPGCLRLHTVNVTENLYTARNSLTQRIMGYNPEGTAANKVWNSYGTIKLNISNMMDGDVAGISVFQDPYSVGAVKMIDGKKYLYSYQSNSDNWEKILNETIGQEITEDSIYLRAVVNFGTNKAGYYYSLDNKNWTKFGVEMDMRFILSIFVGQRFYLFNYATKGIGGYVDIDWFSTEPEYSEERYFGPGVLHTLSKDDLTMESLELATTDFNLTLGSATTLDIICQAKSGLKSNVASNCSYQVADPTVASVVGGKIMTYSIGETSIIATYTDIEGNSKDITINVKVSIFPIDVAAFNPSLIGSGKFSTRKDDQSVYGVVQTSNNGFAGWQYTNGIDLSQYETLEVVLKKASTTKPCFRIYDSNNLSSTPYIKEMKASSKVVIDLHNMVNSKGQKIDPSHIYYAGFSSDGSNTFYIREVILSGNVGVDAVCKDATQRVKAVYDLTGRKVADDISNVKASKGIFIVNGKKVLIK